MMMIIIIVIMINRYGDSELLEFEKNGIKGNQVLSHIAREKFSSIVDIQLMAKRTKEKVSDLSQSQEKEMISQKKLTMYRQRVRKYLEYLLDRRTQLGLELRVLSHAGVKGVKGSMTYGECVRHIDRHIDTSFSLSLSLSLSLSFSLSLSDRKSVV